MEDDGVANACASLADRFEKEGIDTRLMYQTFMEASEIGDADSLRERVKTMTPEERRTLSKSVDQHGCTGLLLAARRGDVEVAEVLLNSCGANPNDADNAGCTACHYASGRGATAVLKVLLDAKADILKKDDRGDTALMWASGAEAVKMLLDAGLDVNECGGAGKTPLMYASAKGDEDAVRVLATASGVNLDACDDSGMSAHGAAQAAEHYAIADMLVSFGAKASPAPAQRVVRTLEALQEAARRGDGSALEQLLKSRSSCNSADSDTSDLNAEVGGETLLLLAATSGSATAIDVLLRARADPNVSDSFLGETALHRLAPGGRCESLMLLLEAKAEPSKVDLSGRKAVDIAKCWNQEDAEALLEAAAEGSLGL
eukprot:TRINITY_DN15861_c0_g1_i1.p1 TRINITY_DN15861_c0_g1~~TRINITY_DN15861_c0_g1_i1.p1  ORF type:complete len:373 (-),score=101.86 TRINITY_DN15861_c0_g1_i1:97-1215(-)